MKLVSTNQLAESELLNYKTDLFVGASGYESRSTYVISRISSFISGARIAFGFEDRINEQRKKNDRIFQESGFDLIEASGDSCHQVRDHLVDRIESIKGQEARVVVDYTSMTRSWYAGVIEATRYIKGKRRVEIVFLYSPAKFSKPIESAPNSFAGPLPGFCGLDVPDKPSALVIGLGYERDRALGLFQYIDPAVSFAFYTDPAIDSMFSDVVKANNAELLRSLPADNIYRHPLADLQRTSDLLLSLCTALNEEYRVVLAPLGVKPFSLICLLLASRYREFDVWRVSAGAKSQGQDREANGKILLLKTVFESL